MSTFTPHRPEGTMEFPRLKLDQDGRQEAQAILEHLAGNEDDLEPAIYELVYLRRALKQAVEALNQKS
jgi:hypothetical protein